MAFKITKYLTLCTFLVAGSAGARLYVSEVHYLPAEGEPPAFMEFYNSSDSNADLTGWELEFYDNSASTIIFPEDAIIPSYGFFLIGFAEDEDAWSEYSYTPDYYADCTFGGETTGGGVALYDDTAERVDAIGWGTVPEDYCEGKPFILIVDGHSIERKSGPNHDELRGNSYDTDNNINDCRERLNPQPQNIYSPREHPSLNAEQQSVGYIKAMYDYQR